MLPNPILFRINRDSVLIPLIPRYRYGLCPALLRANKTVHREASPLLYSGNCFGFTDLAPPQRLSTNAAVASFLRQTGQNASFLRHIHIDFPGIRNYPCPALREDSIEMLELIRDNCTGIALLEACQRHPLPLITYTDAALELLDARFKAIPSLKEVIFHITTYDDLDDTLKKMRNHGWIIKVTKLDWEVEHMASLKASYDEYLALHRKQLHSRDSDSD